MNYKLFLIPIIVMLINQVIKALFTISKGKFSWPTIFSYGGMPSSHAALVVSLLTVLGYYSGIDSPEFAIAVILALLTLRDASGIRWHLGLHGQTINKLIKTLPDEKEYSFPVLNERFGHTHLEIIIGIITGLVLTLATIALWP